MVSHTKRENLLLSPDMQATFHTSCITIFALERGKVHTTELLHRIGSVLTLKNPQLSVSLVLRTNQDHHVSKCANFCQNFHPHLLLGQIRSEIGQSLEPSVVNSHPSILG